MELCRPLPWIDDDKPRLGDFRRQLIGQVKETLQKAKRPAKNNAISGADRISLRRSARFPSLCQCLLTETFLLSK